MRSKSCIVAAALSLFLAAGCATQPIPTSEARFVPQERILDKTFLKPTADSGEVIIKRDSGFGGSACNTRVFANGKATAELATGEKIALFLPIGDHIISAWPNNPCGGGMVETRATVQRNKSVAFRIGYGSNGDFGLYPTAF